MSDCEIAECNYAETGVCKQHAQVSEHIKSLDQLCAYIPRLLTFMNKAIGGIAVVAVVWIMSITVGFAYTKITTDRIEKRVISHEDFTDKYLDSQKVIVDGQKELIEQVKVLVKNTEVTARESRQIKTN